MTRVLRGALNRSKVSLLALLPDRTTQSHTDTAFLKGENCQRTDLTQSAVLSGSSTPPPSSHTGQFPLHLPHLRSRLSKWSARCSWEMRKSSNGCWYRASKEPSRARTWNSWLEASEARSLRDVPLKGLRSPFSCSVRGSAQKLRSLLHLGGVGWGWGGFSAHSAAVTLAGKTSILMSREANSRSSL